MGQRQWTCYQYTQSTKEDSNQQDIALGNEHGWMEAQLINTMFWV